MKLIYMMIYIYIHVGFCCDSVETLIVHVRCMASDDEDGSSKTCMPSVLWAHIALYCYEICISFILKIRNKILALKCWIWWNHLSHTRHALVIFVTQWSWLQSETELIVSPHKNKESFIYWKQQHTIYDLEIIWRKTDVDSKEPTLDTDSTKIQSFNFMKPGSILSVWQRSTSAH